MRRLGLTLLTLILALPLVAQKEKKQVRTGNKEYKKGGFEEAELSYRRAIDESPSYNDAGFNLGTSLYKQEKYDDALEQFGGLSETEINRSDKSDSYYNLGNTLLKAGKLKESIDSYKDALKLNPSNMEAKYNLAYAQRLLQEQQQQQKQQQDKDNQKNDKKDQKDNNKNKNDKQDQQQKDDQKNNKDQQQDKQDKTQDQQQQQQQQMSKEDAERLLQALADNEKEVQEKVKKAKAARMHVRSVKNW